MYIYVYRLYIPVSLLYIYIYIYIYNVDSACKRNEYQEHFLGVKAAGA